MVHEALLTAVSRAHTSNAGSCSNQIFLLLLLLQTLLMLKLLPANLMPLLLVEKRITGVLQPETFLTAAAAKHCARCLCVQFAARFDSHGSHGGEVSTVSGYDRSEGWYIRGANS